MNDNGFYPKKFGDFTSMLSACPTKARQSVKGDGRFSYQTQMDWSYYG
jgi:hypothetical protein